jgi:hypothetical protein
MSAGQCDVWPAATPVALTMGYQALGWSPQQQTIILGLARSQTGADLRCEDF